MLIAMIYILKDCIFTNFLLFMHVNNFDARSLLIFWHMRFNYRQELHKLNECQFYKMKCKI